jgi:hypothetical protein
MVSQSSIGSAISNACWVASSVPPASSLKKRSLPTNAAIAARSAVSSVRRA